MHGVPAASLQVCRPAKPASARCAIPWKAETEAPGVCPQGCPGALMPRLSLVTSSKPLFLPERHPSAILVRYPGRWDAIQKASRLRAQAESPATGQRHPLSSPPRMSSGVAPPWPSARGRKHNHTSPSYLSFPSRLLQLVLLCVARHHSKQKPNTVRPPCRAQWPAFALPLPILYHHHRFSLCCPFLSCHDPPRLTASRSV